MNASETSADVSEASEKVSEGSERGVLERLKQGSDAFQGRPWSVSTKGLKRLNEGSNASEEVYEEPR